jgi:hypothetical protein
MVSTHKNAGRRGYLLCIGVKSNQVRENSGSCLGFHGNARMRLPGANPECFRGSLPTPTDVGTLCAFLTGREKCELANPRRAHHRNLYNSIDSLTNGEAI